MPVKSNVTIFESSETVGDGDRSLKDGLSLELAQPEDSTADGEDKWSPRRSVFVITGICGAFWLLLALVMLH